MASQKIRNFFKKKKEAAKFKLAGPGRKLNSTDSGPSTSNTRQDRDVYVPSNRVELSKEARAAAEAAMGRTQKKDTREFNTSLAAIQAQVRRELEAEKKEKEVLEKGKLEQSVLNQAKASNEDKHLAVQGVYFRCPLISDEILSRKEWKMKIREFLYEQLEQEKALTACLIILNCNIKDKAEQCIETLSKYIDNIITHPDEEKYRKIRCTNKIFLDKIKYVEGGFEFLIGTGFIEQTLDDELFLIYSEDNTEGMNIDQLPELLDALHNSEIINIDLDRNIQVLLPSQSHKYELPPDFYRISAEEVKREQLLRSEAIENAQILKTKAMREKEELRNINRYNFTLVRIRFPDIISLQGTFSVYEKLSHVYEFVKSCLNDESLEFAIVSPTGHKFSDDDMDKSLYDLRLIPNTLLLFVHDNMSNNSPSCYLKEDILMLIQPI